MVYNNLVQHQLVSAWVQLQILHIKQLILLLKLQVHKENAQKGFCKFRNI